MRRYSPCRSLLFVPGNRLDRVEKAVKSGAEGIIIDLEDAVVFEQKVSARAALSRFLPGLAECGCAVFVRINAWQTGHLLDDLDATVGNAIQGVVLPKAQTGADVESLDRVLTELEMSRGLSVGTLEIIPLPETALGMFNLFDLARISERVLRVPGVQFLSPGGDFQRSMGAAWTRDGREMIPLDSKVVLEARAAGVHHVIASTGPELRDLDAVREVAIRARLAGADSAWVMHPSHVVVVNEVFSLHENEIADARDMVIAFAAALDRGVGVIDWKGRVVDRTHIRSSLQLLKDAATAGFEVGPYPDLNLE
jgi:citrate lyase subunit beta/citryl-CoA lyase